MTERDELDLSTGAYALNALSGVERSTVERHLDESDDARAEATELSVTAALLGLASAPVTPSPELRANLMALLPVTPQVGSGPAPQPATDAAVVGHSAEERAQIRWYTRPVTLLVAAAAAVALFAGGALVGQQLSDASYRDAMAQAAGLAELTAAPDAERSESPVSGGGTATLVWSESLQRSAMMFESLPELTGDRVYQLWYIGDDGAVGAGIFTAASERDWRMLEGSPGEASAVGITVEPAGGSDQPTTTPIVVIDNT